ncbi:hypothetical protein [Bowmanella denitrificans]|uniref:hypothetical protein n=1 Tax=Bowmanella denitrificans TaxID=366582 RepID=UPI0031CFFD9D
MQITQEQLFALPSLDIADECSCNVGIRPPRTVEVQKTQEQFSAHPSLDIKASLAVLYF